MAITVTEITSLKDLNDFLAIQPNDKLTIIDFHATWCGPCKMIAPFYKELAENYKNANFLKCDVEQAKPIAQEYGVTAMPTFIFLQGNKKVHEEVGASRDKLKNAIERLAVASPGVTTPFAGKGQTLGGAPAPASPTEGAGGIINLTPQAKVLLGLVGAYILLWYFS
ncbi:thioredoxin-domain-containing protein [Fomitiporia mediterranea MF3/22]|uniref:thioredoxin-domain-containing protein n=1 Tax=Fomitiporia mediterranea (strain MF3/22) TaxID=694068 RepID=UPI0004408091|nr:thioredoxin-domain-containing protein [Fomitiporia mediterranea MF3/22]EJD04185.1 thioredoxin-domain-containing protein [Fomitiporia mediterranea MF3/22]